MGEGVTLGGAGVTLGLTVGPAAGVGVGGRPGAEVGVAAGGGTGGALGGRPGAACGGASGLGDGPLTEEGGGWIVPGAAAARAKSLALRVRGMPPPTKRNVLAECGTVMTTGVRTGSGRGAFAGGGATAAWRTGMAASFAGRLGCVPGAGER